MIWRHVVHLQGQHSFTEHPPGTRPRGGPQVSCSQDLAIWCREDRGIAILQASYRVSPGLTRSRSRASLLGHEGGKAQSHSCALDGSWSSLSWGRMERASTTPRKKLTGWSGYGAPGLGGEISCLGSEHLGTDREHSPFSQIRALQN